MQLACVLGRVSSPNLFRVRYGATASSPVTVAQLAPVRREIVALSSSESLLFTRLSIRPVLPKLRHGGFRVEASGAYSKESFVNDAEASKLAQVGFTIPFNAIRVQF